MILGGALEFDKSHNKEVQERESDNIELPQVYIILKLNNGCMYRTSITFQNNEILCKKLFLRGAWWNVYFQIAGLLNNKAKKLSGLIMW